MCVLYSGGDLPDDGPSMRAMHRPRSKSRHYAAQEFAFQQLHGEKIDVAITIQFEHVDDIRVRKHLCAVKLTLQMFNHCIATMRYGVQNLDRHVSLRQRKAGAESIECLEDSTPAAASQALLNDVPVPKNAADFNG